ncbi:Disulfide bond formation protein B [Thalassocella blandensis]|nr:Disulfide bond formation protein B [Thalassocella blandensis]
MKIKTCVMEFFAWRNMQTHWQHSGFWLAIAMLCLALDGGALFYQHVLEIYPCELCIYVRVWIVAIFLLCIAGLVLKRFAIAGLAANLAGLGLSIGLAKETYNLLVVEYGWGDGGACSFFPNFPEWAPLDQWMPFLFQVQEVCKATPEVLLGISMADALAIVSILLILAFGISCFGSVRQLMSKST